MSTNGDDFTIGVEEEYQIIHPDTRELRSRVQAILPQAKAVLGDQVTPELYRSQIEIGTSICQTITQVREQLVHLRREVILAAEKEGSRIAASGTHPFSHWNEQKLTVRKRYADIATSYQQLAREQLIFGCHVHVGIANRELAIQVMNRSRPWLASLLALSANSPFWLGVDTGYASYRTQVWGRWPTAGVPQVFGSLAEYEDVVNQLVATGIIDDASKLYWDMRPSTHYNTLEYRVTDVCLTVDEAVLVAGLIRALAKTCAMQAEQFVPVAPIRSEVLRAAHWQASRFGLDGQLIDTTEGRAVPAGTLINKLLTFVRPALEEFGEWYEISGLVKAVLKNGTGAARQREAFAKQESLEDVVDLLVAETAKSN
ncbi:carboxylate-amine ligase [Spirosoma utsteinense]|uniref:Putative glutamate--cysteine ligase 2 n=1 Tax=Spirosoma utsteinense TaxID=2585773 RepID=A0ABR6W6L2_9BACT|nr:carboxylate-amine ligase [Spirosoma utsteinense]MBC3787544.1 carboxylate-amine ligase [Spirosoma utsteinense]MBC3792230.1 carboxylate-amine ligase [Spirosoma utsteinense]